MERRNVGQAVKQLWWKQNRNPEMCVLLPVLWTRQPPWSSPRPAARGAPPSSGSGAVPIPTAVIRGTALPTPLTFHAAPPPHCCGLSHAGVLIPDHVAVNVNVSSRSRVSATRTELRQGIRMVPGSASVLVGECHVETLACTEDPVTAEAGPRDTWASPGTSRTTQPQAAGGSPALRHLSQALPPPERGEDKLALLEQPVGVACWAPGAAAAHDVRPALLLMSWSPHIPLSLQVLTCWLTGGLSLTPSAVWRPPMCLGAGAQGWQSPLLPPITTVPFRSLGTVAPI